MRIRDVSRWRVALAVVALVALGCDADPNPNPNPDPVPKPTSTYRLTKSGLTLDIDIIKKECPGGKTGWCGVHYAVEPVIKDLNGYRDAGRTYTVSYTVSGLNDRGTIHIDTSGLVDDNHFNQLNPGDFGYIPSPKTKMVATVTGVKAG